MSSEQGRFVTGSTFGHVVRMTMTGAMGITFVFLVDAANLFWISRLSDERLMAAIGYAFAIQFFTVSIGVGMMIAATALISRSIGQGHRVQARDRATASMILTGSVLLGVAALVFVFRHHLVAMAGARGETAILASRYLSITVPSLAIMAIGLIGSATLRAEGDGRRAMLVTIASGSVAMVIDPLLIVWLKMGLDGAAAGLILSRCIMAVVAFMFVTRTHDLLARPRVYALRETAGPFFRIALPALLTQMAAPFGNYLLTGVIAQHGESAVAAWAVINRLTVVAFGGLFSLGGAVAGIFGQNFGAGQPDRVKTAYRDALVFCLAYTAFVWAALFLAGNSVARAFALDAGGQEILRAFTHFSAGLFVFVGAHYVSNAAFNTLGRPVLATLGNWLRDGALAFPAALWLSTIYGASGVIYAQALAATVAGTIAAAWGWRFVASLGLEGADAVDQHRGRGYRDLNRFRRR